MYDASKKLNNEQEQEEEPEAEKTKTKKTLNAVPMTVQEASQILGMTPPWTNSKLRQRYAVLYEQNSPQKGGSIYLQAKVETARKVMESKARFVPDETKE
eukprot:TRINITY_DN13602_c0_g1_i1.p1 TRINITY_DN13602_c0_g1~~TRINITY_DN13602_c0_g1_i1.p1  ORF type:complete len:100 (+),score=23.34 TRINITY_DN13602_c0_g1_i1:99-398(+)